jgi:hypothetical protein
MLIQHLCQAGSAEADLEFMFKEGIIGIADDCSIGPLGDVDSFGQKCRVDLEPFFRAG